MHIILIAPKPMPEVILMANKKTRNAQRKNNDQSPPARREAKSELNDDTRVIHGEEPNRDDG